MNTWPLVFGLFTLSACADPATPQQPPEHSQDVVGTSMPLPSQHAKKPILPQQKVDEETEMNLEEATRKINEIDQRLEYLRRYIGPGPNK